MQSFVIDTDIEQFIALSKKFLQFDTNISRQ
jgi:hypothetical protein